LSAAVTPPIGRSAAAHSLAAGPSCCCSVAALLSAGAHPAGPNAPAGARPPLPARWTRAWLPWRSRVARLAGLQRHRPPRRIQGSHYSREDGDRPDSADSLGPPVAVW